MDKKFRYIGLLINLVIVCCSFYMDTDCLDSSCKIFLDPDESLIGRIFLGGEINTEFEVYAFFIGFAIALWLAWGWRAWPEWLHKNI